MADLRVRWSEHESGKAYARPFMVTFVDDGGAALGSVALSGHDLLYQRQFRIAVAALAGELFIDAAVEAAPDPQRAWLERLAALLPAREVQRVEPRSTFDHDAGRVVGFVVACAGGPAAVVDAAALHEYQELQAVVAHQTGGLLRIAAVESVDDPRERSRAWDAWLRAHVERPPADEAMAASWPWR